MFLVPSHQVHTGSGANFKMTAWKTFYLVPTKLLPYSPTINGVTGTRTGAQRLILLYLDGVSFGQRMPFTAPCSAGCTLASGIILGGYGVFRRWDLAGLRSDS